MHPYPVHGILAAPQTLDKHTNLATSLLGAIKVRALDQYHSVAEELLTGKADLAAVLRLLNSGKGAPMDKLRLAAVYILAYDGGCVTRAHKSQGGRVGGKQRHAMTGSRGTP